MSENKQKPERRGRGKALLPKFINEYILLPETPQRANIAARRAGYKDPHRTATQLMKREDVQDMIESRRADIEARLDITPEKVAEEYARIAFYDPADYFEYSEEKGVYVKPSHVQGLAAVDMRPIKKLTENVYGKQDKDRKQVIVEFHDKMVALKEIRDMMGYDAPKKTEVKKQSVNVNVGDQDGDLDAVRERLARRINSTGQGSQSN